MDTPDSVTQQAIAAATRVFQREGIAHFVYGAADCQWLKMPPVTFDLDIVIAEVVKQAEQQDYLISISRALQSASDDAHRRFHAVPCGLRFQCPSGSVHIGFVVSYATLHPHPLPAALKMVEMADGDRTVPVAVLAPAALLFNMVGRLAATWHCTDAARVAKRAADMQDCESLRPRLAEAPHVADVFRLYVPYRQARLRAALAQLAPEMEVMREVLAQLPAPAEDESISVRLAPQFFVMRPDPDDKKSRLLSCGRCTIA